MSFIFLLRTALQVVLLYLIYYNGVYWGVTAAFALIFIHMELNILQINSLLKQQAIILQYIITNGVRVPKHIKKKEGK